MAEYFHKVYHNEVKWADDKEATEQQIKNMEVMKSGAIYLYDMLVNSIIRCTWKDRPGYELKKKFFDKGYLVCSFSGNTLQKKCGVGRKIIEKWTKTLIEAGWIVIDGKVRDGQKVFVLGTYGTLNGKYAEILYRHKFTYTTNTTNTTEVRETDEQVNKKMMDHIKKYQDEP